MDEHPNVTTLRRLSDRMSSGMEAGDIEAIMNEAIADDVEWHEIGRAEPTIGKAAMAERVAAGFGDTEIKAEEHDTVANDTHAVQLMNVTARRGDKTLNYRTAEIFHMKDGKITARWAFSDDTARIMEFFGS
jgi:ketosteroid isomerase-like protein